MLSSYYKIKSDIHALNPFLKIVNLLIFVVSILIAKNFLLPVFIIFEILLVLLSNIPANRYFKSIYSLRVLIIFILIINTISNIALTDTISTIVKLISVMLYSNLLIYTTTPMDIIKGLNVLLKPLEIVGVNINTVSLMISLSLRFIPTLLDEGKKIISSIKLRNVNDKMYVAKSIVFPLFFMTIDKADRVADVMSLKNYDINKKTSYKLVYNYLDYLLTLIHVIMFLLAIGRW